MCIACGTKAAVVSVAATAETRISIDMAVVYRLSGGMSRTFLAKRATSSRS
jgi:hypothetical protein